MPEQIPEQIEERIAYLEAEVERLKNTAEKGVASKFWWEEIAGAFANNSAYDEVMRLGREYRNSLCPDSVKPDNQ
jgi:hypothetical protein